MTKEKIITETQEILSDSLEIPVEEITLESKLVSDLGAESLDILDLLFKSSKAIGVKVTMKDIQSSFRDGLSEEEFINEQGVVSEAGRKKVENIFGTGALPAGELTAKDLLGLLDVKYIVSMFEKKFLTQ